MNDYQNIIDDCYYQLKRANYFNRLVIILTNLSFYLSYNNNIVDEDGITVNENYIKPRITDDGINKQNIIIKFETNDNLLALCFINESYMTINFNGIIIKKQQLYNCNIDELKDTVILINDHLDKYFIEE